MPSLGALGLFRKIYTNNAMITTCSKLAILFRLCDGDPSATALMVLDILSVTANIKIEKDFLTSNYSYRHLETLHRRPQIIRNIIQSPVNLI